jgi:hypothetical protein
VDSPRLDASRIERLLRGTDGWLTPKAVEGFDEDDFSFLAHRERRELTESVRRFLRVAEHVPGDAPASEEQVRDALPNFKRIVEILRPDKYADIDALKIGKQVEQIVGERLPSWVKEMVFETGSDAVGDPALWIWVEVDDRAIDGSSLIEVFQPVRRELEHALEKIGTGRWPYIRLRSSSEQRPTTTTKAKTKE